jgi:hypothetical protein
MTVTNAGAFTTGDAANLTVGTDFVQNGAGVSVIGDDLTSTADGISFATNVTLTSTDALVFTTGLGTGDDLVITGTTTGTDDNLTITAAAVTGSNVGSGGDVTLGGNMALGTGSLTITTATTIDAANVSAATIKIGSASSALAVGTVNTGAFASTTTTNIEAHTVNAISVTATGAEILAAHRIINASVTSDTLTVRGGEGVLLINTTIGGRAGGEAFRNINILPPFDGVNFAYRVNGVPFGPERNEILSTVANLVPVDLNIPVFAPGIGANNSGTILDQVANPSGRFQPIPFFFDFDTTSLPGGLVMGLNQASDQDQSKIEVTN